VITIQMYLDLIYLRTQNPRTEHSSTKVPVYETLLQQSSHEPLLFAFLGAFTGIEPNGLSFAFMLSAGHETKRRKT
jgi:hypothetical protein